MFKNTCWVNWFFIIMVTVLSVLSIGAMLSGCGNKGALYMPDTPNNKTNAQSVLPKK